MAMNASAQSLVGMITNAGTRFVVPVFQRPYCWEREHCEQLWEDILAVGRRGEGRHFTGAIVWVQDGVMPASGVTPLLLVDGQQRIATVTLLLVALAEYAREHARAGLSFSQEELLSAGYLVNRWKKGDDRYKLTLSQGDCETLKSILDHLEDPGKPIVGKSERLLDSLLFFRERLTGLDDPNAVWDGVQRLEVVSISLDAGQDNPQMIFESMNATGKELSPSDLARNFVLMCLPTREQEELYRSHWRVIEERIGPDPSGEVFKAFLRGYLMVLYAPKVPAERDVYPMFKRHVIQHGYDQPDRVRGLLDELKKFADYHAAITGQRVNNPCLKAAFRDLAELRSTTLHPMLMSLCRDFAEGTFGIEDFEAMLRTLESYIFRRIVCKASAAGMPAFLSSLIARLDKAKTAGEDYRKAFEACLAAEQDTVRRFPDNGEFTQNLYKRNSYRLKTAFYMLSELENQQRPKDPLDFSTGAYTIEHIMPRNALRNWKWKDALAGIGRKEFRQLVNNIGNLTLTAYNAELSDGSFEEKLSRKTGGYRNAHLALSRPLADKEKWTRDEIAKRADWLVGLALKRWPALLASSGQAPWNPEPVGKAPRANPKVSLSFMLEEGLLSDGDILYPGDRQCRVRATVVAPETLVLSNGETFDNPTSAAQRALQLDGRAVVDDGWKFWRRDLDGPSIGEIREKHLESFHDTFWSGFRRYASEHPDFVGTFPIQAKLAGHINTTLNFELSGNGIELFIVLRKIVQSISVGVSCQSRETYQRLVEHKSEIRARLLAIGGKVFWDKEGPHKVHWNLSIWRRVNWKKNFSTYYKWIADAMIALRDIALEFGN